MPHLFKTRVFSRIACVPIEFSRELRLYLPTFKNVVCRKNLRARWLLDRGRSSYMESCVVACVSQRANTRVVSLSKRHSTRGFERALWRVRRSPVWLINYSTLTLQHSDSALERERESVCSRFKVSSTLRLFVLGFKTRRAGERATPLLSYELCVWIRVVFAQADRLSTLP